MLLCRGALVLPTLCPKPEITKVAICFSLLQNCPFSGIRQSRQRRNLVNITLYYAEELFGGSDPPKSVVPICLCPKIVSDSGYGQAGVGGQWFRMPSPLTAIVPDYVHPPQLRQPDRHKCRAVADEADLLHLHCGLEARRC